MKTEDEFDVEIKKEYKYAVVDGIVKIAEYKKIKHKILWILKEADKSHPKEKFSLRDFMNDVTVYSNWKATHKRIAYCSYGIIHDKQKWNYEIPDIDCKANIDGEYILNKIALININKTGGGSRANYQNIQNTYFEKKDILIKQIKAINPDIIINCSRVQELSYDLKDLWKLEEKVFKVNTTNGKKDLTSYFNKNKLVINFYHPNCTNMSDENYYNGLLNIYFLWNQIKNK